MKRILKVILLIIVVLLIILFAQMFLAKSRQISANPVQKLPLDANVMTAHLTGALQIQTISFDDPAKLNSSEFQRFHDYLAQTFPLVHQHLQREIIKPYSLLYRWQGTDTTLAPVVLMAHMDVVPVESAWKHPAFGGQVMDGYIWGRGALDDKSNVISQFESVEYLLHKGFQPKRTMYFAYGHDEEAGGSGAHAIVDLLKTSGIHPQMVVDEGGAILDQMIPGVLSPTAMIGTSEKGYVTLELILEDTGGHSSAPPRHTLIGEMSEAVKRLEDHQMPAKLEGSAAQMMDFLGPELRPVGRFFLVNRWLFQPVMVFVMGKDHLTNAMVRTTTAVTVIQGGVKENVLPSRVVATVNFRIRPGETMDDVMRHVRQTVANDKIKIVKRAMGMDPSPVSSADSSEFQLLHRTIREVFPGVIVVPGIVIGATDSRYYAAISPNVFRFAPFRVNEEDFRGVHGTDERIKQENYVDMIRFYVRLIENVN